MQAIWLQKYAINHGFIELGKTETSRKYIHIQSLVRAIIAITYLLTILLLTNRNRSPNMDSRKGTNSVFSLSKLVTQNLHVRQYVVYFPEGMSTNRRRSAGTCKPGGGLSKVSFDIP